MTPTYETRMTVPTRELPVVTRILADRGCVVLDRGERTTTDEGMDAEATLHVLFLDAASAQATSAAEPTPA